MLPADVPALAALFQASIAELAQDDYDDRQRKAWMALADDEIVFGKRLRSALTIVATLGGDIAGFISLGEAGRIDLLYVDPASAREGVGSQLCEAVERLAIARKIQTLTADASDTARPFFEALGFAAKYRQTATLGDQWLGSTRMEISLGAAKLHS